MNSVLLVAAREFKVRAVNKVTIITMVIISVVLIGGGALMGYFAPADSISKTKIALDLPVRSYGPALAAIGDQLGGVYTVEVSSCEGHDDCVKKVEDGDVDYAVTGQIDAPVMISDGEPGLQSQTILTQIAVGTYANQELMKSGVNVTEINRKAGEVKLKIEDLAADAGSSIDSPNFNMGAYLTSIIITTLLMLVIAMSGGLVSSGIIEEKTSRVVEVLLSTVRPAQLLAGKIIGIVLLTLLELTVLGASAIIGLHLTGLLRHFAVDITNISVWAFVWFFLGVLSYATLYAGVSALAARQEDLGVMNLPLTMMQVIAFYLGMFLSMTNVNSVVLQVISYLPFFNCFTMPFRQAYGAAQTWEMLVSAGINIVVIPGIIWLAGRLYHAGILHTGSRLSFAKALRGADKPLKASPVSA